jgi:hypothetical protein
MLAVEILAAVALRRDEAAESALVVRRRRALGILPARANARSAIGCGLRSEGWPGRLVAVRMSSASALARTGVTKSGASLH